MSPAAGAALILLGAVALLAWFFESLEPGILRSLGAALRSLFRE